MKQLPRFRWRAGWDGERRRLDAVKARQGFRVGGHQIALFCSERHHVGALDAGWQFLGQVEALADGAPDAGLDLVVKRLQQVERLAGGVLHRRIGYAFVEAFGNVASILIKASGLKSRAVVQEHLVRANAVRDLCVLAKLPGEAVALIQAGVDVDQARTLLFEKIVANSSQVEIDNKPPAPDHQPAPSTKAADPGAIYASRKPNASKGAHK